MSISKDRIIEINTSGYEYTGELFITGYNIITSNTNAVCKIQDINKSNVIALTTTTGVERTYPVSFAEPTYIKNLKVEVWTNIERVVIYVSRFGSDL